MSESTIALTVSIVTALVGILGAWRLWLEFKANSHFRSREVSVEEWAALLEANKCLQDQLEQRLAANDAEIRALYAKMEAMEARHGQERERWTREKQELMARVACLESENQQLREELDSLKARNS